MGMNRVQMQAGLSMPEFLKRFGTEAQCEAAVMAMRWPARRFRAEQGVLCRGGIRLPTPDGHATPSSRRWRTLPPSGARQGSCRLGHAANG